MFSLDIQYRKRTSLKILPQTSHVVDDVTLGDVNMHCVFRDLSFAPSGRESDSSQICLVTTTELEWWLAPGLAALAGKLSPSSAVMVPLMDRSHDIRLSRVGNCDGLVISDSLHGSQPHSHLLSII